MRTAETGMSVLAKKNCTPCRGGVPQLDAKQSADLLRQIDGWTIEKGSHLTKSFKFPDFAKALAFVNRVGAMAEKQGHHPDIYLAWEMARVEIWTHKINGLTESDFIFAAKTDGCL